MSGLLGVRGDAFSAMNPLPARYADLAPVFPKTVVRDPMLVNRAPVTRPSA
jgi:hypothetical protein